MKKILVTGAFGQIGSELVPALQKKYGQERIVAVGHNNIPKDFRGILEKAEITDLKKIEGMVKKHHIGTIYHLVSILSARGEQDPQATWKVNMDGLKNILDLAVSYKLKVFWPSSIAVFGPTTPRDKTPQRTILEPTTMYGISKMAGEGLCHYYFLKYSLDVRSVRYPGLISWKAEPGGGTTDFAVAVFYEAIKKGYYQCFVKKETTLPMMYMDDGIRGTINLMEAQSDKIKIRTSYNLAAISFRADELVAEIRKYLAVKVVYMPDHRQKIADSWPKSIDDSEARRDWGWRHDYNLPKMVKVMLEKLEKKLKRKD